MESWENEQPGNLLSVWLIRRTWKSQQQVFILQNLKLFPSVTLSHAGRGKVAWIIVSQTGKNRHFHLWNWSCKFSSFNHMIWKDIFVLTNHSSPLKLTLDDDLTSNFKLQNLFWPRDWSWVFPLCPKWQYNKNYEQFVKKENRVQFIRVSIHLIGATRATRYSVLPVYLCSWWHLNISVGDMLRLNIGRRSEIHAVPQWSIVALAAVRRQQHHLPTPHTKTFFLFWENPVSGSWHERQLFVKLSENQKWAGQQNVNPNSCCFHEGIFKRQTNNSSCRHAWCVSLSVVLLVYSGVSLSLK